MPNAYLESDQQEKTPVGRKENGTKVTGNKSHSNASKQWIYVAAIYNFGLNYLKPLLKRPVFVLNNTGLVILRIA